jgi:hypothetical protein
MQDMLVSSRADFESLPPAVQRKVCILSLLFFLHFHPFSCVIPMSCLSLGSHMTGRKIGLSSERESSREY